MTRVQWLTATGWAVAMVWLFSVPRTSFDVLMAGYSLAFGLYLLLLRVPRPVPLHVGLGLALVVRLAGLFFMPLWSDDFYRFIWDGMLSDHGINPMTFTPEEIMAGATAFKADPALFAQLNHTAYHSVYPPIAQAVYWAGYAIAGTNLAGQVLFMKSVILAADAGVCLLLMRLLPKLGRDRREVLWYALSPLVIMELSGNLHFEGVMLLGLLAACMAGLKGRRGYAILAMAGSVLSKMVTLILAPFLPNTMDGRRLIPGMLAVTGITVAGFWIAFGGSLNWMVSVGLWFQKFEFNAGPYYLVRWVGYQVTGYNAIHRIGPAMGLLTLAGLCLIWIWYRFGQRLTWMTAMTFALTLYFMMGTTIHPWYLTTLLAVGLLAGLRYPLAWSYLVVLSYSHYDDGGFREHYGWIALEYIVLLLVMAVEWWAFRKKKEPLPTAGAPKNSSLSM